MKLVMVSLMLVLPGFLVSGNLLGQQPLTEPGKRLRVTTIRIDRSHRFNSSLDVSGTPVVQAVTVPTQLPAHDQVSIDPQSVLVPHLDTPSVCSAETDDRTGQVVYQQERADYQASPSDYPADHRRGLSSPADQSVRVDSRYESVEYFDRDYPQSEYQFVGGDRPNPQDIRTPIGFCIYRKQNNPFCPSHEAWGGTAPCCDEWADFCPCFGLSRFRYFCKKDCFYGKTGCHARHAYKHGKWLHDEGQGQCVGCNAR